MGSSYVMKNGIKLCHEKWNQAMSWQMGPNYIMANGIKPPKLSSKMILYKRFNVILCDQISSFIKFNWPDRYLGNIREDAGHVRNDEEAKIHVCQ